MSNSYRPLLPATGGDHRRPHGGPGRKDGANKKVLTAACEECRDRKIKCGRQRPKCQQCSSRGVKCMYDALPGETRAAALRAKSGRMQNDLNTMMELYWHLRNQPKQDALSLLEEIQSGVEPYEILDHLRLNPQSQAGPATGSTGPNTPATSLSDQTSNGMMVYAPTTASDMLEPSNVLSALEYGFDAFFNCTGCIWYVYERDEAQKSLDVVRECLKSLGPKWSDAILRDSVHHYQKAAFCSICIIASVGLQYTRDPIPAMQFVPSTENGAFRYVSAFYEMSKHLLDATIETSILEAIKVCAAFCIFNTILHATVALANADMGINFFLNLGPDFKTCPVRMNETTWVNYKRVARTLVTLRGWLVTSLGFVYGDNPVLQNAVQCLIEQRDLKPAEVIQQELAKIVHIEANLLRTRDNFNNLSPLVLSTSRHDLSRWHDQLPQWMHLKALAESNELPLGIRRTVYLVHLFYLSANILVARLAHNRAAGSPPHYDNEGMVAASDGLVAARTSARILRLQFEERTIYQKCWLCIFTSYMSSLVLLHSTAQQLLHGYPQHILKGDLAHAESCIDVLEHCGRVDSVSEGFAKSAKHHYQVLSANLDQTDNTVAQDQPDRFEYLFNTPSAAPDTLKQSSHDLLQLISHPFGHPTNLHTEGILKAGFGSQQDWNVFVTLPFNRNVPDESRIMPLEVALSGIQDGQFLGSSAPHGWDAFANTTRA